MRMRESLNRRDGGHALPGDRHTEGVTITGQALRFSNRSHLAHEFAVSEEFRSRCVILGRRDRAGLGKLTIERFPGQVPLLNDVGMLQIDHRRGELRLLFRRQNRS